VDGRPSPTMTAKTERLARQKEHGRGRHPALPAGI
jgi:hypothetical protein